MRTSPPYILLGNGMVAARFLADAIARQHAPSVVVLNAPEKQRDLAGLRTGCAMHGIPVMEWSDVTEQQLADRIVPSLTGPWLLAVHFGHLVGDELLSAVEGRAVNLHAAMLPICRGVHTNVWPIIEGTPAGVTLHGMVRALDAGPVLVQRPVPVEPWDTAATLYARLERAELNLLRAWPDSVLSAWPGAPQNGNGSTHRIRDLAGIATYSLDDHPEGRELYDLLRARTGPRLQPLRVIVDGVTVDATIELTPVRGRLMPKESGESVPEPALLSSTP